MESHRPNPASMNPNDEQAEDARKMIAALQAELASEQRNVQSLRTENSKLKATIVHMGEMTEKEEEWITNHFFKRLNELRMEKERLLTEVEREEELITNSLTKKMMQLQQEKIDIENELEKEQECIVNRLQTQLQLAEKENASMQSQASSLTDSLKTKLSQALEDKIELENELEQEQEFLVNRLQKQLLLLQQEHAHVKTTLYQQFLHDIDQVLLQDDATRIEQLRQVRTRYQNLLTPTSGASSSHTSKLRGTTM